MLEIGSLLDGKYKILSEIGRGGMSVVYMALNEKANKTWAVKQIRKDAKLNFNIIRQGLVTEIEILKKLKHPNIPSIIDIIEDEESCIIVMDYIEGNSLDKILEEQGAQPQEDVVKWALQLCDALGYLHSCNPPIIYRDMKPANIMLRPDGNITLIDFGTAKTYEIEEGETTGIGTIGYAAPEQYVRSGLGRTDVRTDIYCLGITLYHLITGIDPCKNVISDRSIRTVNHMLSPGLDEIIIKCTEPQPENRYQSCAELYYALEHYGEMGEIYKKKQKKKLFVFLSVFILSVAFAQTSMFGYILAENKKSENYDVQVEKANNPNISQDERIDFYINAIKIEPAKTEAYLKMIEMFISESETFHKSEAATIIQLKAGVEKENSIGFLETIYPFEELKKNNPDGYAEVCNEIGFAYWYDYEVESDRKFLAVDWFGEAKDKYSIAKIYCDIGENQRIIKKYENETRLNDMNNAYKILWSNLKNLREESESLNEIDIKILIWNEIINIIYEKASYFLENTSRSDMGQLLSLVQSDVTALKDKNCSENIRNLLDVSLSNIHKAYSRIGLENSREK